MVGSFQTADGRQAFPETSDPQALHEIGQVWHDANLPPDYALTPQGFMAAVGLWRMAKGFAGGPAPVLPPTAQPPAQLGAGAAALAEGGTGPHTGLGGSSTADAHLSPEARSLRRALDQVETYDRTLGFRKNRRAS
jgi:hypothetical protein